MSEAFDPHEKQPGRLRTSRELVFLLEDAAGPSNLPEYAQVNRGKYSTAQINACTIKHNIKPLTKRVGNNHPRYTETDQRKILEAIIASWPSSQSKYSPLKIQKEIREARERWMQQVDLLLKSDKYLD